MTVTVTVLYSCPQCGLKDVEAEVIARGEQESLGEWVEGKLSKGLTMNHSLRSPGCRAKKMVDVQVPITGIERIGGEQKEIVQ